MSKVHASKRTRHVNQPTAFRIIPRCLFCGGSGRLTFVSGADDWGDYVTVKCCRAGCEAEGPHVRVMIWEGGEVTDAMRQDAADGWSSVWNYVDIGRPSEILVDRNCKEVEPRRARKPRALRAPEPTATAEHRVHAVAPPTATNGHNGHHNGSVL